MVKRGINLFIYEMPLNNAYLEKLAHHVVVIDALNVVSVLTAKRIWMLWQQV